ncbi:MAG: DUF4199 domain-containing protein [Flavisolibacter sp.]
MENNKPISHITAGLIIGSALIVLSLISIYVFKGGDNSRYTQWLTYIVICAGLIVFISLYGKANDYALSFGDLFAYGFKATAVYALISIGFIILFNLMVPDFKEKGIEMARQNLEDQGKLTDTQIEQALQFTRKYFWAIAIGRALIGNLIIGAIGSLIGAAVTKKRPKNPLEQLNA